MRQEETNATNAMYDEVVTQTPNRNPRDRDRDRARSVSQELLRMANNALVARGQTHGPLEANFGATSKLWSSFLDHHISPTNVAVMMSLFKIGRIRAGDNASADHYVDAAAYMAIAGGLAMPTHREGPTAAPPAGASGPLPEKPGQPEVWTAIKILDAGMAAMQTNLENIGRTLKTMALDMRPGR